MAGVALAALLVMPKEASAYSYIVCEVPHGVCDVGCGGVACMAPVTYTNAYDSTLGQVGIPHEDGGTEVKDLAKNNSFCVADPVSLHDGQFLYQCNDLNIPGRKINTDLSHAYNSGKFFNGQFGYGWTLNYYMRLYTLTSGDVMIVSGESKDQYTLSGSNYTPPAGKFVRLIKNADNTWTLTQAHGEKYQFDTDGKLTAIQDRNNNTITLTYAAQKQPYYGYSQFAQDPLTKIQLGLDYRLTQITDTTGRVINFNYNADGLLEKIVDNDREVKFTYDPNTNDLLSVTRPATAEFPSGITKSFVYENHKVKKVADPKQQYFVENTYDTAGRVAVQNLGGSSFLFDYSVTGQVTQTDRKGFRATYVFNANGNVLSGTKRTTGLRVDDPALFTTTYTYNNDSLKTSVTYPKGNGVKFVFDESNADYRSRGNLLQVRKKAVMAQADNDTNDLVIKSTYEPQYNQPKAITDALGNITMYTYDYELSTGNPKYALAGDPVKVTYPAVAKGTPEVNFTYNTHGQVVETSDANGKVTQYTYYPTTGYLKDIVQDPAGVNAVTTMAYDSYGSLASVTDPENRTTSYNYDALGWRDKVTTPAGFVTKYSHDANGNVTRIERQVDADATQWQVTQMTYDILNHLKTSTDPLNRTTTYNYDNNEKLASVTDAEGKTTSYEYDERDLPFKVKDANTPQGVTQTDYDINGNVKKLTDANGHATTYAYDLFDRKFTETFADSTYHQYTYDKNSNLTVNRLPDARTVEYDHDALNRLIAKRYPSTPTLNATFDYDLGSGLTDANTATSQLHYTYDNLSQVAAATQTMNGTAYGLQYQYFKDGKLKQTIYPSGKIVDLTYDASGQPDLIKDNGTVLAQYQYDPLGRLASKSFPSINATTQYQFDLANQLALINNQVSGASVSQYGYPLYDNVGNRKTMQRTPVTGGAETTQYGYDNLYQLTTVSGAQAHAFTFDSIGNRATADGIAYTPNTLNQYSSVNNIAFAYDGNGNLTSDGAHALTYDEENRLITAAGAAFYAYDALGQRVSKTVGGATTYYIHNGDQVIAEYTSAGTLQAEYIDGAGIDDHLTMDRNGNRYYFFQDGLGSVSEVLNASGAVAENYTYDVYGQPSVLTSSINNPYRFTGRAFDEETGLYDYRARVFSPALGRFLQRDPIGTSDDINPYRYVRNSPNNFVDPKGRWASLVVGMVIGAVSGGISTAAFTDDPVKIAIGVGMGAVTGAIPGSAAMIFPKISPAFMGGAASLGGNIVNQLTLNSEEVKSKGIDWGSVAIATASGAVGGNSVSVLELQEKALEAGLAGGMSTAILEMIFQGWNSLAHADVINKKDNKEKGTYACQ